MCDDERDYGTEDWADGPITGGIYAPQISTWGSM